MKRTKLTDADREVIGEIRRAIEERGHFRGQKGTSGKACLMLNPVWDNHKLVMPAAKGHGYRVDYMEHLFAAISEVAGAEWRGNHDTPYDRAIMLNDALPTEELLDILAALEVG